MTQYSTAHRWISSIAVLSLLMAPIGPVWTSLQPAPAIAATTDQAVNLIPNPSFETPASATMPAGWSKGGYGTNTAVFTYPVSGYTTPSAVRIDISTYTSGDRKWYLTNDIPVTAGQQLTLTDWYQSNVGTELSLRYHKTDGTYSYPWLKDLPASPTWQQSTATFTVPAGVDGVNLFHILSSVGWLVTDEVSLTDNAAPVGPVATTLSLTSTANPVVVGAPVSLTTAVQRLGVTAVSSTGTVTVSEGAVTVGSATITAGTGSVSVAGLVAGTHHLTATYSGDSAYLGSAASLDQVVNPAPPIQTVTTTVLQATPNPAQLGQPVTVTSTVSANGATATSASGTVSFFDGGAPVATSSVALGVATWTTSSLTSGQHTLSARYNGDSAFLTSTSSTTTLNVQVPVTNNLVTNPSLVQAGTNGTPTNWFKGGYGTNSSTMEYPVAGHTDATAIKTTITAYTSGDRKWYFTDVPVIAGQQYVFSDWYQSNVDTDLTIRYHHTDGTYTYPWLQDVPASATWAQTSATFTVPTGVDAMTVFHAITSVGWLTLDDISVTSTVVPPPPAENLIPNPSLEEVAANGKPASWNSNKYGTNNGVFTYPVLGNGSGNAAQVTITNYTSGDAKWYFNEVPVTAGTQYRFSDEYTSTGTSGVTLQYHMADGTYKYAWINDYPAATNWTMVQGTFVPPANAVAVTIFHVLRSVGSLTVDDYQLSAVNAQTQFAQGMVSINFDDGWLDAYQNALPILDTVGYKATLYMITNNLSNSFAGYMHLPEIQNAQTRGYDIAAHTQTHAHLPTLTPEQLVAEIDGSRTDLINAGFGAATTLAYPYGEYNAAIEAEVLQAGFTAARTTHDGLNYRTTVHTQLTGPSVLATDTFASIKSKIDTAIQSRGWLILTFHRINNTPMDAYTSTPAFFQQVVDYLHTNNVMVITNAQGVTMLNP